VDGLFSNAKIVKLKGGGTKPKWKEKNWGGVENDIVACSGEKTAGGGDEKKKTLVNGRG